MVESDRSRQNVQAELPHEVEVSPESINEVLRVSDNNYLISLYMAVRKNLGQESAAETLSKIQEETGVNIEDNLSYFSKELNFPKLKNYHDIHAMNSPMGRQYLDVSKDSIIIKTDEGPAAHKYIKENNTFINLPEMLNKDLASLIEEDLFVTTSGKALNLVQTKGDRLEYCNGSYQAKARINSISVCKARGKTKVAIGTPLGVEVLNIVSRGEIHPEGSFSFEDPSNVAFESIVKLTPDYLIASNLDEFVIVENQTGISSTIKIGQVDINSSSIVSNGEVLVHFAVTHDMKIYYLDFDGHIHRFKLTGIGWEEKDVTPKEILDYGDTYIDKFEIVAGNRMFLLWGEEIQIYDVDDAGEWILTQEISRYRTVRGKEELIAIEDFELMDDGKLLILSQADTYVFDGEKDD